MNRMGWIRLVLPLALGLGLAVVLLLAQRGPAHHPAGAAGVAPGGRAATASGPLGGVFVINGEPGVQVSPTVAYNSQDEEYLVVWHNEWPANRDIYGQRVSRDGTVHQRRVLSPVGGNRYNPDVAYNSGHNEYLVVWEDDQLVYGRRVSAEGLAQGDVITISPPAGCYIDPCGLPAVAYASTADRYLVVWQSSGLAGASIEASALEWDGSDVPLGQFDVVPYSTTVPPANPDVAYNRARNEFLIVWEEMPGTYWEIHGRRVRMNPSPAPLGTSFPILDAIEPDTDAAVAAIPRPTGTGQYLVVSRRDFAGTGQIYAQRVTGDGIKQGTAFAVLVNGLADRGQPAVAGNEHVEQYLIAWTHAGATIRARAVFTDGVFSGEEVVLGGTSADRAAIAGGPLGDFLVAFDDVGNGRDIYGHLWGERVYLPLVTRQ